jgi:uncharacterized membrane protein
MRLLKIGILIIAVGFLLLVSGVTINPNFHNISSTTITTARFHQLTRYDNGFYVTEIPSNMTSQATDWDIIVNPNSDGPGNVSCLIPMKDLSNLSYYTLHKFGIKPSNNDSANIWFNNVPKGSYAFVEAQNNSLGLSIVPEIPLDVGGILAFAGAVLIFSGFVITIIAIVDRRR